MSECLMLLKFCSSNFTTDVLFSFPQTESLQNCIGMIQDEINFIKTSLLNIKQVQQDSSLLTKEYLNPIINDWRENEHDDSIVSKNRPTQSAKQFNCSLSEQKRHFATFSENIEGLNLLPNGFDCSANQDTQLLAICEYNTFASNEISAIFDCSGGELRNDRLTPNYLIIPQNAIPRNLKYEIASRVCISYLSFETIANEEDICFVSPVMEYTVKNNYNFQKHVKIIIYPEIICCGDSFNNILVYTESNGTVYEIPFKHRNDNCISDCWYQKNESSIVIYTQHFSKFVCVLKGLLHKKRIATLKVLLYGQIGSNDDGTYYARLQYYNLFNCKDGLWNVFWKVSIWLCLTKNKYHSSTMCLIYLF